uniref:E3 ubiquitin-protein ligase RNF181-like n=1 Tax=Cicer arietinum TaxID=3827 RepID=A0A1S2Z1A5_CICAR|nr:E3 ubiquitin-protein ligase RNF181-like [Cicer arietinum]
MEHQRYNGSVRVFLRGPNGRITIEVRFPIRNGVYEIIPSISFRAPDRNLILSHMTIEDGNCMLCESTNDRINDLLYRMNTRDILPIYAQNGHYVLQDNDINHVPTRRRFIHNLERIRIDEETAAQTSTCSICLVDFSFGSKAICLPSPCSHVYHENCIMSWLNRSNTCPLCRRLIS